MYGCLTRRIDIVDELLRYSADVAKEVGVSLGKLLDTFQLNPWDVLYDDSFAKNPDLSGCYASDFEDTVNLSNYYKEVRRQASLEPSRGCFAGGLRYFDMPDSSLTDLSSYDGQLEDWCEGTYPVLPKMDLEQTESFFSKNKTIFSLLTALFISLSYFPMNAGVGADTISPSNNSSESNNGNGGLNYSMPSDHISDLNPGYLTIKQISENPSLIDCVDKEILFGKPVYYLSLSSRHYMIGSVSIDNVNSDGGNVTIDIYPNKVHISIPEAGSDAKTRIEELDKLDICGVGSDSGHVLNRDISFDYYMANYDTVNGMLGIPESHITEAYYEYLIEKSAFPSPNDFIAQMNSNNTRILNITKFMDLVENEHLQVMPFYDRSIKVLDVDNGITRMRIIPSYYEDDCQLFLSCCSPTPNSTEKYLSELSKRGFIEGTADNFRLTEKFNRTVSTPSGCMDMYLTNADIIASCMQSNDDEIEIIKHLNNPDTPKEEIQMWVDRFDSLPHYADAFVAGRGVCHDYSAAYGALSVDLRALAGLNDNAFSYFMPNLIRNDYEHHSYNSIIVRGMNGTFYVVIVDNTFGDSGDGGNTLKLRYFDINTLLMVPRVK